MCSKNWPHSDILSLLGSGRQFIVLTLSAEAYLSMRTGSPKANLSMLIRNTHDVSISNHLHFTAKPVFI